MIARASKTFFQDAHPTKTRFDLGYSSFCKWNAENEGNVSKISTKFLTEKVRVYCKLITEVITLS